MTSIQFTSLNTFRPYPTCNCRSYRHMYVRNTSIAVVRDVSKTLLARDSKKISSWRIIFLTRREFWESEHNKERFFCSSELRSTVYHGLQSIDSLTLIELGKRKRSAPPPPGRHLWCCACGIHTTAAAVAGVTFADTLRFVESREMKFSYREVKFSKIKIPSCSCPHYCGYTANSIPIPTVLLWLLSPFPLEYRHCCPHYCSNFHGYPPSPCHSTSDRNQPLS